MVKQVGRKFPKNFLWGASINAHQVSGSKHSQWSIWEVENAKSLAAQAPYRYDELSKWTEAKKELVRPSNYVSGHSSSHASLSNSDFDMARQLGLNSIYFNIEWSDIQPTPDGWDSQKVDYYREYIKQLKARKLEPIVSMFDVTLPEWFVEAGGFTKRRNLKFFVEFVERFLEELRTPIKYLVTINNPVEYARKSYYEGLWPPQLTSQKSTWRTIDNLAVAHNQIAKRLHAKYPRLKISLAIKSDYYYPGDDSRLSVRSSGWMQYLNDDYLLRKVIKRCDFVAVSYFASKRVYGYRVHGPDDDPSDVDISMNPSDLEQVVERLATKYHRPILVTGSGIADAEDLYRKKWLAQTVLATQRAIAKGVPVVGFVYYSLLDGFEWEMGFWPRYGLIEVRYKDKQRRLRPSAVWYARVIKNIQK